jgi:transcription factor TFIIIB component B''
MLRIEKEKLLQHQIFLRNEKTATASEENEGGKSSRKLRKRVAFQLIDEPDDEANDNGSLSAEPPSNSSVDEDEDYDDEFRVESKSQKKRAPRKSKKPEAENGKPVRKRKKANEAADQSTKEPPKKFSHSTRRNRRCGK